MPLPQVVADELARHLSASGRRDGLIVAGLDGRPARLSTFTVAWRRAVVAAGAPAGLRLHDLRHSYASALIAAGESVKTVQVRMGHAPAMVTLDVYGHLWPDSEERTRAAVDAWLAAPADSRGLPRRSRRSGPVLWTSSRRPDGSPPSTSICERRCRVEAAPSVGLPLHVRTRR